jgi:hypothetical protein
MPQSPLGSIYKAMFLDKPCTNLVHMYVSGCWCRLCNAETGILPVDFHFQRVSRPRVGGIPRGTVEGILGGTGDLGFEF